MKIFKESKTFIETQYHANNKLWRFHLKIIGIIVGFGLFLYSLFYQNTPGKGEFDKSIKKTENVIAYIHYPIPGGTGSPRNSDIYLLDVKTGEQLRLNRDRFEDDDLSWSPDATRLLFTSRRSQERIAQFSDVQNPSYLYIYDFRSGKERSLESALASEVYRLGEKLKKKGYEIKHLKGKYLSTNYPFWIDINLIGFMRHLPYGLGRGYGDICSSDTLGHNFMIYRDLFKFPKWWISHPQWINKDSIIVKIKPFASDLGDPQNIALYLPKKGEFIFLTNVKDRYEQNPRLSFDKKKILYREYIPSQDTSRLIVMDLTTREQKVLVYDVREAVFSPHGSKIAFIRRTGWDDDIYIMNSDGTNIKRMTFDGGRKRSLAWSPKSSD